MSSMSSPPMQSLIAELSRMQIADFFRKNAPTQDECDQLATRTSGRVCPSAVQGSTSYTVVPEESSGPVVQFRATDYTLDLAFLAFVEQTYGRFVPRHRFSGTLGGLSVYTMDNVGGVSAYLARDQLREGGLAAAVQDLAGFFAAAWHNTPASMPVPDRGAMHARYRTQLQQLRQGFPARFHALLDRLLANLGQLFADDWPLVAQHTDLLENNLHVDPATGRITGVCDWCDAAVGPFGTSIEGLECLLGERTTGGWRWVRDEKRLRQQFWQALAAAMGPVYGDVEQRVAEARLVGIFLKHGLEWVDRENKAPVKGSRALDYLEAVTRA